MGTSKDWLEPYVGGRANIDLSDKVSYIIMGDVGGFGIGSASDLTAKVWAGFNFKTGKTSTFRVMYNVFYIDYSNGSGSEEFGLKGLLHGPWIGFTFVH